MLIDSVKPKLKVVVVAVVVRSSSVPLVVRLLFLPGRMIVFVEALIGTLLTDTPLPGVDDSDTSCLGTSSVVTGCNGTAEPESDGISPVKPVVVGGSGVVAPLKQSDLFPAEVRLTFIKFLGRFWLVKSGLEGLVESVKLSNKLLMTGLSDV